MAGGVTGGAAGTWSDRFEQGLHPFIEAFNASIGFDLTLLQEDLDGSIAHARMLASVGVITEAEAEQLVEGLETCLLYTSPSPRDGLLSRMPSSA